MGLGLLGMAFYAAHAIQYLLRRQPEHALWACHLGALTVGVGLLLRSPVLNAVGVFWLVPGLLLWFWELSIGGEFIPTSVGTHIGGLCLGIFGLRRLGLPDGTWWKGIVALMAVVLVTRLITPPASNVNMSHGVYNGWEETFPSHAVYMILGFGVYALVFLGLQFGLRKAGVSRPVKP